MKINLLLICILTCFAGEAFPWGANGHRAVGEIAQQHLSRKAKKKLGQLLSCDPLAEVSVWMDEIKSDDAYDHTHDWHWVTIPEGMQYKDTEKNPNGDIYAKIDELIATFKAGNLSTMEEIENIKYLAHLVGDIHQPLHVGLGEDAGGNKVAVKWFGKASNLHKVWDSEMIESKQLSFSELVRFIGKPSKTEVAQWQSSSLDQWATESVALRSQIYALPENGKLGYAYMYENFDTVQLRILQAGVRLAGILNEIYG